MDAAAAEKFKPRVLILDEHNNIKSERGIAAVA